MSKGVALNTSCVLYIGAIPYNWDVEVIKSVVCGSGPIVDVRCMMDSPGKNKGFCFVEYATPDDAQRALRLLSQIKIEGRKKLRIELSKEGLRNPSPVGTKPELLLSRNYLPANVVIPSEMLNGYDGYPDVLQQIQGNPQLQRMVQQMAAQGMDMKQITGVVQQYLQQPGQQAPQPARVAIPNSLLDASNHLPKPEALPLVSREKISETLSTIHPAVLIQLIATLKQTLEGPNQQYTATILNSNPQLAIAAAQALLLMGVIDTDVINQAVARANPQQHTPPQPLDSSPVYTNIASQQIDPEWAGLSPTTIEKLSKMDKSEASLIVQVLKLPHDQVENLPPQQKVMVEQLRNQYR